MESARFCEMKRCQLLEQKHAGSTRLELVKTWKTKGKGEVEMQTAILRCPHCGKRIREYLTIRRPEH